MSRFQLLSDAQWSLIEDALPRRSGRAGRPFADARMMVEAIIYRYRCGIAWRDLPGVFGPWQTVWSWHRRLTAEGTWDLLLERLLADADARGLIDWSVSVDSTIGGCQMVCVSDGVTVRRRTDCDYDEAEPGARGASPAAAGAR